MRARFADPLRWKAQYFKPRKHVDGVRKPSSMNPVVRILAEWLIAVVAGVVLGLVGGHIYFLMWGV